MPRSRARHSAPSGITRAVVGSIIKAAISVAVLFFALVGGLRAASMYVAYVHHVPAPAPACRRPRDQYLSAHAR